MSYKIFSYLDVAAVEDGHQVGDCLEVVLDDAILILEIILHCNCVYTRYFFGVLFNSIRA